MERAQPAQATVVVSCVAEQEKEVRSCLQKRTHNVQIDFTEGRLAVKIYPSGNLLHRFIDLNNLALTRFSAEEQGRIGIHTCPGSDRDSTSDRNIEHARSESEGYGRPRLLIARPTLSHHR
jgi:5-methyltetrahydropteroyltriglutamate--homocysteine methyltransferase